MADRFSTKQDELLIDLVSSHPILWDMAHSEFKNSMKKDSIWAEIGNNVINKTGPQCKKRWRSIRDHYKKQRKSELSGSAVTKKRASYWDRLNFLEINGDERETFINASQSSSNDYESCDREPSPITVKSENSASSSCGPSSKSQECSQPPNKRSKIQTSDHTFEGLVKERCEDREQLTQNHNFRGVPIQEDENDLFFKSIALSVKKLDPDLAGEVKRKIFEIVTDYEAINRRHSLLGGLGVARIREAPG